MIIKKGTKIFISHIKRGDFTVIATKDFDTNMNKLYPVALAQDKELTHDGVTWKPGEQIPCHKNLCETVTIESKTV